MTLDWSTRSALRLYPQHWRDEFEREVVGTLMDAAEAEQRSRPPLNELLPLAARGAWMRARSSVVFWAGLVIVALMIWTLGRTYDGFVSERYWPVMLSRAGIGLFFALPLAGASVAWRAGRRRAKRPLGQRMRELLADAAGPAVFVALGYLATIGAQVVASGWPVTATVDPRSTFTYFCMLLAALAFGGLIGTLMRAAIAVPVTAIALGLWYLLPTVVEPELGNLSGTWLLVNPVTTLGETLAESFALVSLAAIAAAVLALTLTVVKVTRGWVWFAVILALVAIAVPVNARSLTGWWQAATVTNRTDAMVCEGDAPRLCLWPEQEAEAGELIRSTVTDAYEKALTLGIPVPNEASIDYRLSADPDRIVISYSDSLFQQFECDTSDHPDLGLTYQPPPARGLLELRAGFAIALYLGADPSRVWTIQVGGEASGPATNTLDLAEMKDHFDVHDLAEAKAVVLAWAERGPTCE